MLFCVGTVPCHREWQGVDEVVFQRFFKVLAYVFLCILKWVHPCIPKYECHSLLYTSSKNSLAELLLYQNLFSEISQIYENESMPGYDIFIQATENATRFPYYSYSKLMTCNNLLSWNNILNLTETMDNKTVYQYLLTRIENDILPK